MAVEFISAVFNNSKATMGARLVMIVLADKAGHDGYCFPSAKTIAREAHLSERQVFRIIPQLVKLGELEVVKPGGRGVSQNYANTYRILLDTRVVSNSQRGMTKCHGGTDIEGKNQGLNVIPTVKEPSYNKGVRSTPRGASRRPLPFGETFARASTERLENMAGQLRGSIREITNRCGRPYAVEPTGSEEKKTLAELRQKLSVVTAHLENRRAG